MRQKYLTTAITMRKHILPNVNPNGIRIKNVIPDRFSTVNAAIDSYREAIENYAINASERGPQGMSTAQSVKHQKTTLKKRAQASL